VADAVTPDELIDLAAAGRLEEAILPVAGLLPLPRVALDRDAADRFVHGSTVRVGRDEGDGRRAVFDADRLLGIGTVANATLQPEKVIVPQEAD